jgi:hypothetical protein
MLPLRNLLRAQTAASRKERTVLKDPPPIPDLPAQPTTGVLVAELYLRDLRSTVWLPLVPTARTTRSTGMESLVP